MNINELTEKMKMNFANKHFEGNHQVHEFKKESELKQLDNDFKQMKKEYLKSLSSIERIQRVFKIGGSYAKRLFSVGKS